MDEASTCETLNGCKDGGSLRYKQFTHKIHSSNDTQARIS